MTRVYVGQLVGHADVNADPTKLSDNALANVMWEAAGQVASATDPCVPGSVANDIFAPQRAAVLARYDVIAAECRRRGRRVVAPEQSPGHARFKR